MLTVSTQPSAVPGEVGSLDSPYVRNMVALWQWDPGLAMQIDALPPTELIPEATKDGQWTVRISRNFSQFSAKKSNFQQKDAVFPQEKAILPPKDQEILQNKQKDPAIRPGSEELLRSGGQEPANNGIYLHSKYRPLQEAEAWAAGVDGGKKYVIVIHGFGMGYHVRALWKVVPSDALVIVAEPDLGLLRLALEKTDYSEMLGGGRVLFFTALERGRLVERLEPRSALLGSGLVFAGHQPSVRLSPGFHGEFQKLITEFVAYTRTGFITLMLNNVATCQNIACNLGRYVSTPVIDGMKDVFLGRPAVLVAAGPSLAKNMHLLHEVKGKVVIIAVQTMLKPLLAAGIEPDFVTSLDYNTVSTRFFENLEEAGAAGKVHLVAEAKANWNVLDVFGGSSEVQKVEVQKDGEGESRKVEKLKVEKGEGGRTMSVVGNEFADRLLRDLPREEGGGMGGGRMSLKAGATVAHLSFYLAEFLGCDPVILVGQDLGFVDGLYYKPGTAIHETWGVEMGRFNSLETKEWERIARSKTILRKIPDIHGDPMYTEEQFFVYLQQFERDFAASRCKVIDATEGGARKEHVTVITLREAIDRFCGGKGATNDEIRMTPPLLDESNSNDRMTETTDARRVATPLNTGAGGRPWKTWSCDVVGRLRGALGAVGRRRGEAEALRETCRATVPLLEEMIEKQTDEKRMRELFVEVDRLRSKVGADQGIFEMVTHLNAIGEVRRFQHELAVRGAEKDSLDRQKRQLMRDVDYVQGLEVGCERLLEILDQAAGRLERQIAAVEAGRGWPVEVAGGAKC